MYLNTFFIVCCLDSLFHLVLHRKWDFLFNLLLLPNLICQPEDANKAKLSFHIPQLPCPQLPLGQHQDAKLAKWPWEVSVLPTDYALYGGRTPKKINRYMFLPMHTAPFTTYECQQHGDFCLKEHRTS